MNEEQQQSEDLTLPSTTTMDTTSIEFTTTASSLAGTGNTTCTTTNAVISGDCSNQGSSLAFDTTTRSSFIDGGDVSGASSRRSGGSSQFLRTFNNQNKRMSSGSVAGNNDAQGNTSTSTSTGSTNVACESRVSNNLKRNEAATAILNDLNRLKVDTMGLYGRENELALLTDAFHQLGKSMNVSNNDKPPPAPAAAAAVAAAVIPPPPLTDDVDDDPENDIDDTTDMKEKMNLVLLAGKSGTGKSAIVKEFRRQIYKEKKRKSQHISSHQQEHILFFVSGKFEQYLSTPYAAFTTAFTQLVSHIITLADGGGVVGEEGKEDKSSELFTTNLVACEIRELIQQIIGSNYQVLTTVIPNIGDLLLMNSVDGHPQPAAEKMSPQGSKERRETSGVDIHDFDSGSFDISKSKHRLKHLILQFLHAICQTKEHNDKLVLFLDDLQWIDPASLDLLETILTDPTLNETMLIISAYRDDDEIMMPTKTSSDGSDSATITILDRLEDIQIQQNKVVTHIEVAALPLNVVHDYINDLLNVSSDYYEASMELASIAYRKVNGNIFFLIQFLTALRDGGLLRYNLGLMKWTWDTTAIQKSTVVSNNVLSVLMQKMNKLPSKMKQIVAIASCLGASFEESVVDIIVRGLEDVDDKAVTTNGIDKGVMFIEPHDGDKSSAEENRTTKEILDSIVQEGLLERLADTLGRYDDGPSTTRSYCFAHDQIEFAAQVLLLREASSIQRFKLQIARILYKNRLQFDYSSLLFTIVSFWNEGKEFITDKDELQLMIELNYEAGKKALESSAFEASVAYFRSAIDLIPPEKLWSSKPTTTKNTTTKTSTLQLYNSLVKAEYSNGNWNKLHDDINVILGRQEISILDKMVAYSTWITTISSYEHKHDAAISLAVDVLSKLGVTFRPSLGKLGVVGGLIKTKLLLRTKPLEGLFDQPEISDAGKIAALDIIVAMTSSLYAANPDLYMCTILKTLRWSLKYGNTKYTSRCIALYGVVDMALGSIQAGTKACDIALRLAEKQGLMDSEYAPITMVYGFVYPWTTSLQSCGNHLLRGYNIGLVRGDLEFAFINVVMYCFFCFCAGKPLSDLEADMRDYARQMREFKMELQLQFLCLTWQTILNLMGRNDGDPLVLTGEVMSQDDMLLAAERDQNPPLRVQLYCHRLQLAVFFNDYVRAAHLIEHTSIIGAVNPGNPIVWRTAFFEGIAAFEMVRRGGQQKFKRIAMKALGNMKKWVQAGNVNCSHCLCFLEAEKAASENDIESAKQYYNKAIVISARFGFRNDRALGYERCGLMYDRLGGGEDYWAKECYKNAYEVYLEMEAYGKIDQMNTKHRGLGPSVDIELLLHKQNKSTNQTNK